MSSEVAPWTNLANLAAILEAELLISKTNCGGKTPRQQGDGMLGLYTEKKYPL